MIGQPQLNTLAPPIMPWAEHRRLVADAARGEQESLRLARKIVALTTVAQ